jgi:hypothetical protein
MSSPPQAPPGSPLEAGVLAHVQWPIHSQTDADTCDLFCDPLSCGRKSGLLQPQAELAIEEAALTSDRLSGLQKGVLPVIPDS